MSEIVFLVEDAAEGRLIARALGHSIFTEADSYAEMCEHVRDAVQCHFDEGDRPSIIRLHYVKDEVLTAEIAARHGCCAPDQGERAHVRKVHSDPRPH